MKTVERSDERILISDIFEGERTRTDRPSLGMLREPARDIPVYRNCDVLVVGGGPSGTAAAVAASRRGCSWARGQSRTKRCRLSSSTGAPGNSAKPRSEMKDLTCGASRS